MMSNINDLIAVYEENARNHGNATLTGGSKKANSSYDNMIDALKDIYSLDSSGQLFLELLKNESESVRLWSATHALFINESLALSTLEDLANGTGVQSFSASMVVDEWKKGNLSSPF